MTEATVAEWAIVCGEPSLLQYYKSVKLYSHWRRRFVRAGLLTPKRPRKCMKLYNRAYYRLWRPDNVEKTKIYKLRHKEKKKRLALEKEDTKQTTFRFCSPGLHCNKPAAESIAKSNSTDPST
jgi:hypothetical protein